ncbi:MAG: 16S rRNA (adenine(1518)-N(6)/adenine(1519)-N(6))-dimethyltransferase RsmA [Candidatus Peregrinibacteria bacterium]
MNLTDGKTIIDLLKKHGLWAKKRLGQNFLISSSALSKIVKTADISQHEHVVEIGPGLGVLTRELSNSAKKVTSVELDSSLLPALKETLLDCKNVEIINMDALKFIPPAGPYKVVANIPYNITSPLINHFLQAENKPSSITLLVQKEVAEKICQLEPKVSILSLQIALFGKAEFIKGIPSTAFFPIPNVDSAIIRIILRDPQNPDFIPTDEALKILKTAKQAFSQKRKKLSNTLPHLKGITEIDLNRRPETLSVKEWQTLNQLSS